MRKAVNKQANKASRNEPEPSKYVPSGVAKLCAPEFHLVRARMREAYATRLGGVHLPGGGQRTHVRRSRHLSFYDPKVEGRQVTRGYNYEQFQGSSSEGRKGQPRLQRGHGGFGHLLKVIGRTFLDPIRVLDVGSNVFRGGRAPRASVRGNRTHGHPFKRHGLEFRDPYGPQGALQPRDGSFPLGHAHSYNVRT
ncbi:hypothetical protein CRG98_003704 [Punica granatum]|uniref:Uncharacterized protein n=1 Tax=Punica granatum TaxID=22663 RepID=A0A2I0L5C9_PUNGR|nr:hypothetical protein CRG98_003704 [Punica granatum]